MQIRRLSFYECIALTLTAVVLQQLGTAFVSAEGGVCCYCRTKRDAANASEIPDEQRLMNYLLHGYELSVRPVFNSSRPVVTLMGITLTQIFDMDEKNQVLVSNVWLDQKWKDEFLTWDPTEFSNQAKIRLPSSKIWKPDLVLYNNAADFADSLMPALAMIDSNGTVFWPIPTKLRSSCKVDVTYFPFDQQVCNLKFGSWTYDGYQVDLHLLKSDVDVSSYVENGEWELLGTKTIRNVVRYPCCPEPYPDVTFYLFLRRRLLYYMYHVIYPCIMMSTLTLLVFCLPPDSGEKIALGITVLLAFSVLMLSIADRLPETSESVPLISIYLTVVMSMTSVSVIMTVFVLNLHHRGPSRSPVPNWLRRLLLRHRISGIGGTCAAAEAASAAAATTLDSGAGGTGRVVCGNGPGCARATSFIKNLGLKLTIDSLAGEMQASGLATAEEDEGDDHDAGSLDVESSTLTPLRVYHAPAATYQGGRQVPQKEQQQQKQQQQQQILHQRAEVNRDILEALRKIIDKHDADDSESRVIDEWRAVAQFVDKLLFWVYLMCTSASTIIILVIAPVYRIIPHSQMDLHSMDVLSNSTG